MKTVLGKLGYVGTHTAINAHTRKLNVELTVSLTITFTIK